MTRLRITVEIDTGIPASQEDHGKLDTITTALFLLLRQDGFNPGEMTVELSKEAVAEYCEASWSKEHS